MARLPIATLVALVLLGGCASTGPVASGDVVTVALRHPYVVCAGVCANDDVTVWPDGQVQVVQYHATPPVGVTRFRVSRDQAARFASLLAPYRPALEPQQDPVCQYEEGDPGILKVTEIEITWSGRTNDRLAACIRKSTALIDAINQAMRSIGLSITGHRPQDLGLPRRSGR